MKKQDVLKAVSMPIYSPSYKKGPHIFRNREFMIISYETDLEALKQAVPEPLELDLSSGPIVKYEFIKMPDCNEFGSYTESGQVIPVLFNGRKGNYVHSMFLDDICPIVGGREVWGFPKKYGIPEFRVDSVSKDCYIGILKYGELEIARATMGYKFEAVDTEKLRKAMECDNYLIKLIPDVDYEPKICQLVNYPIENVTVKEAWTGPASLQLFDHALAPISKLPVKKIVGALHFISDLTLGKGKVDYDYLNQ